MVEINCDNDAIGRVVALTGEAREDRDDRGQFCVGAETAVSTRLVSVCSE